MNFLKSVVVVWLIFLVAITSVALFPIFFFIWGIINRKQISLWLSISLVLMSAIVYLQLYVFFSSFQPSLDLFHNPSIYYGICLITPFLLTRLSSLKSSPLTNVQKNLMSLIFFFLLIVSSLVLVVLVQYLSYKRHFPNYLFITEAILILWTSLVTFLFIRYPEDMLIKKIQQYGPLLYRWIYEKK